ncbi:MAG: malate dehydrogenase [Nitrospirae bacterium RIFOXYB2_FULL_43_5]|nr:MAG: malate dehydrogenase [Nitrospirae bacterium GWF2_44_13]OGW33699.1 MAG: malate dehydrogenase [Nitrospirae bacterium GWD2_44_7]OGW66034.1 MAG: malate dehydrogenase [Nitrospirae bacterium RIFOXYA2_FULL_44_9]OGW73959.1 MAG: malate dehydrogenase [Nitrospirae bacterium RIFOXYC2_FULL_44_7]OGW74035.1 MAG: malate dehydrogenase [Nitrospirae bacterium RIFOXYB2_FULL_43_5]HBG92766.1 malate dehydrogenase [Nitrospiraceae bacterium]
MRKKVSVIGAGNVGASAAQMVVQASLADVVLFDIADGIPQGKALDIAEACPIWNSSVSVKGTNSYADTKDSDIVVITAGFPRKPNMSRDDLLHANADVVKAVSGAIAKTSPNAIVIIVTNPMDVMAQLAWKTTEFSCKRVIGMGGILDAARLRAFLSWELNVSPEDIETIVLGGHGDQMVPLPRFTTVKGIAITEFLKKKTIDSIVHRTRNGGAEIVSLLKSGSAYYAPAAAVVQMIKSILLDEKRLIPCAAYLNGEYGMKDVYLGVPVILGREGVERVFEIKLTKEERAQLKESCSAVKKLIKKLSI